MRRIPLDKNNIYINEDFLDQQDFFENIIGRLEKQGLVKKSYYKAVIDREKEYPTGLDTGVVKVAIPHTDYEHSNVTQIVVTTLEKPINFNLMDDPDSKVEIDVIFLILFDNPEKQLELLQSIMTILRDHDLLSKILKAKTSEEVYNLLEKK